jgi:hypothetical protein
MVENPDGAEHGAASVTVDGASQEDKKVQLTDDGRSHEVHLRLRGKSV